MSNDTDDRDRFVEQTQNRSVATLGELESVVKGPALPACKNLFMKNIRTISSSTIQETSPLAYVDIDFTTLSEDNKRIALEIGVPVSIGKDRKITGIKIAIPLAACPDDESIATALFELSEHFARQPLLWAPGQTLAELKSEFRIPDNEEVDPQDFVVYEGYYYDPETSLFFLSEELCRNSKIDPTHTK
jgi:hypothetical protein